MKTGLFLCLTAALVLGWNGIGITQPSRGPAQPSKVPPEVWQKAQADGVVRIGVELDAPFTPEGYLSQQAVIAQRQAIHAAQDALLASLARTKYRVTQRLQFIPGIGLEVGADALAVLERSPLVKSLSEDAPILKPGLP